MVKLLFLSVLIAMIVLPARAARSRSPGKGLSRAMVSLFLFNIFYWLALLIVYFNLWIHESPATILGGSH